MQSLLRTDQQEHDGIGMFGVVAQPLTDDRTEPDAAHLATIAVGRDATEQVSRPIHAVPFPADGVKPLAHRVIVGGEVGAQPVLDATVEAEDVGLFNAAGNGVKTALVERAPRVVVFPTELIDIGYHIVAHLEGVGHKLLHLANRHQEVLLALFIVLGKSI